MVDNEDAAAPADGPQVHIGEVVDRTGLSHRTIRYYEEMGLIRPSARTEGGFRLYGESDIDRLLLIKPMKPLGFSVEEMRRLVDALDALADDPDDDAARDVVDDIHAEAQHKVDELRRTITRAEQFTGALSTQLGRHP